MLKKFLLFFITVFVIFIHSLSLAEPAPGDKDVFEKRLTVFLATSLAPKSSDMDIKLAADELIKFSSDYPDSEFANDALILPTLILFIGASSQGDKATALLFIDKIEAIANKYPSGRLSDFTCEKWRELLGQRSSGAIFIPYRYLPAYMRGTLGVDSRSFPDVINNFQLLKENLDFSRDASGMLTYEIYAPLLIAYKYLGRTKEFNNTIKEATKKFPDNALLMDAIKKLTIK